MASLGAVFSAATSCIDAQADRERRPQLFEVNPAPGGLARLDEIASIIQGHHVCVIVGARFASDHRPCNPILLEKPPQVWRRLAQGTIRVRYPGLEGNPLDWRVRRSQYVDGFISISALEHTPAYMVGDGAESHLTLPV